MTKLISACFIILVSLLTLAFLILSKEALVVNKYTHPLEVKKAVQTYRHVTERFFNNHLILNMRLNQHELDAIASTASHLLPFADSQIKINDQKLSFLASISLNKIIAKRYLNLACVFSSKVTHSIEYCQVGSLYLPGFIVKPTSDLVLSLLGQSTLIDLFNQLLRNSHISQHALHIKLSNPGNLKTLIKADLKKLVHLVKRFEKHQNNNMDDDIIAAYITHIEAEFSKTRRQSFAGVLQKTFHFAKVRTEQYGQAAKENAHAIFAIAAVFANKDFIRLLNFEKAKTQQLLATFDTKYAHINFRYDLTLHFLYSAIIEQISNEQFAFNIGELKELFDANEGGSGFDLSDLAADMAGAKFAKFISSNNKNAKLAQRLLTNAEKSDFFPKLQAYPKKIEAKFFEQQAFGEFQNQYTALVDALYQEISSLPLYQVD